MEREWEQTCFAVSLQKISLRMMVRQRMLTKKEGMDMDAKIVESLQCQATWRADRCIKNLGGYPEGHPIDG